VINRVYFNHKKMGSAAMTGCPKEIIDDEAYNKGGKRPQ
jgi:hypothetical protein